MFKTNLGKTGLIFPQGHPYYRGIPPSELTKAIAYLPPENSYRATLTTTGNPIELHLLHNEIEIPGNMAIADDLINLGYTDIKLLPDFNEKDVHLRKKFLPKGYVQRFIKKNPDALITDRYGNVLVAEFKNLKGENTFSQRIKEASEQADYVVIKLDFEPKRLGVDNMSEIVNGRFKAHEHLKGVMVLNKEGALMYEQYR